MGFLTGPYGCAAALVKVEERGRVDKSGVAVKDPRMPCVQRSGKHEESMAWARESLKNPSERSSRAIIVLSEGCLDRFCIRWAEQDCAGYLAEAHHGITYSLTCLSRKIECSS
jgi:hypothetical protein